MLSGKNIKTSPFESSSFYYFSEYFLRNSLVTEKSPMNFKESYCPDSMYLFILGKELGLEEIKSRTIVCLESSIWAEKMVTKILISCGGFLKMLVPVFHTQRF
jgi:hypothetical protein